MVIAALLTLLACVGVAIGVLLGQSRILSAHLGAAGSGLLCGIALFWLLPETAEISGWTTALGLTTGFGVALALLDHFLIEEGWTHNNNVVKPLLIATAIHSFLDGWSVRATAVNALAAVAVPIGLALHKIPEGLAVGWVVRRALGSSRKAMMACLAVEFLTLFGALLEPRADRTGIEHFGLWWIAAVLAVIAGSFLFLGFHTVIPERRKLGVMAIFFTTVTLVGGAAALRR
ncbi:MAG: ZIP family metal transporter [Bryobacteraceae bacterium]